MDDHDSKVARISSFLKNRKSKKPVSIYKKSVSHQVPKPGDAKKNTDKIDVSGLNNILNIDPDSKTCICEPGATFYDVAKKTLEYGLVPKLVPELKTITVGGAVSGCSVESMSYKYGGFHDSCIEYEIITAKGKVMKCNRDENKLLFEMVHGSFGTIGILTKIKFELIPAKKFVRMNYAAFDTLESYKKGIASCIKKKYDFIDGIIHSRKKYVLCLGTFTDSVPYTSRYDWMNVFHKSTAEKKEDYMETLDYFFRYDADCHWVARNYGLESPLLRFLFGKLFLGSTNMLKLAKKITPITPGKPDVVVDVFIPFSNLGRFFEFYFQRFDHFPVWIVPYKIHKYPWLSEELQKTEEEYYIDIAIYGIRQRGDANYYRLLEEEVIKLSGTQT
ncbi:MAG: FAD-binding oxidoreductase, partial [Nanoarchaeota archaeon]|nr:FAD-binding oxidoreductase [Nanoarchaeota archaeon]